MKVFTNSWPKTQAARNYRFFSQILLEAVDDQAWEASRSDSTSFCWRLSELLATIGRVERRELPKPTLTPLLEELNACLSSDPIAFRIIESNNLSPKSLDLRLELTTESLRRRVELILELTKNRYRDECQAAIHDFCKGDGKKKDELAATVKQYSADLISSGVSRRFVFEAVIEHFFNRKISRCTGAMLDRFFAAVSPSRGLFEIYFSASKEFSEYISEKFKGQLFKDAASIPIGELRKRFSKVFVGKHVVSLTIRSLDAYSAAATAERLIGVASVFARFSPNMQTLRPGSLLFVWSEKKELKVIKRSSAAEFSFSRSLVQRRYDNSTNFASYMFDSSSVKTTSRLLRSIELASYSMNALDVGARIVPLWSAFEALLPQPTKDKESVVRISHFSELIGPCILFDQVDTAFQITYREFREAFGEKFSEFVGLRGLGGSKAEKLASIVLGENDFQRELFDIIGDNPLAAYRIWRLNKTYSSAKAMKDRLDSLGRKVEWQLHRIYRERNNIVHSGESSYCADHLLVNAYSYYQSILFLIERIARVSAILDSDQAIELINISYKKRMAALEEIARSRRADEVNQPSALIGIMFSGI